MHTLRGTLHPVFPGSSALTPFAISAKARADSASQSGVRQGAGGPGLLLLIGRRQTTPRSERADWLRRAGDGAERSIPGARGPEPLSEGRGAGRSLLQGSFLARGDFLGTQASIDTLLFYFIARSRALPLSLGGCGSQAKSLPALHGRQKLSGASFAPPLEGNRSCRTSACPAVVKSRTGVLGYYSVPVFLPGPF